MRILTSLCTIVLASCGSVFAAGPLADVFDGQLKNVENDLIPLMEAMPAERYVFAPTSGEFKGVRTFGAQAKHIATVIYQVSAVMRAEKAPVDIGANDDGPAALKTKAEIMNYVKGSLAYGHKALAGLNEKNQMDSLNVFGSMSRIGAASMLAWHSFDHYGQMVVYARMNGVVPPASLPRPAAPSKK